MYHQHHPTDRQRHTQQQLRDNGYATSNAATAGAAAATAKTPPPSATSLDHALLESLFYNEMVMLEQSARPAVFPASLSPLPTEDDTPHTIAEKEILRDFGVGGETNLFVPPTTVPATNAQQYNNNNNAMASGYTATSSALPQTASYQQQQPQPPIHRQQQHQRQSHPIHHQAQHPPSTMPQYASNASVTYTVPVGGAAAPSHTPIPPAGQQQLQQQQPQSQQMEMVCMNPQATATAAAAAAAMLSRAGSNDKSNHNNVGIKVEPRSATSPIPGAVVASPNTALRIAPVTTAHPMPVSGGTTGGTVAAVSLSNSSLATNTIQTTAPAKVPSAATNGILLQQPPGIAAATAVVPQGLSVPVPEDRARQLVDQFATLASRLGIDLPDSVLQSLTSAAAKNDPTLLMNNKQEGQTEGISAAALAATTTVAGTTTPSISKTAAGFKSVVGSSKEAPATASIATGESSGNAVELSSMAPTIMELGKTAEEAIAAVTKSNINRARSVDNLSGATTSQTGSTIATSNTTNSGSNDNKPTYSKRRKKPRLSDCEAKLAQLKAENEQLKRHLQNVSNKAHKFDKEKEEAGNQLARLMHDPNVGPREMEMSVRKFSDMYSDYGINRQQELSFHFEQLQRLVNPTNFTKMGLWTLGQSPQGTKKNPIAGILVKELDITPQQGRKILDQSEKIRKLCDNLKETHDLLVKLKYLCEKKTKCFQDRVNKCTEILTSKQVVKLMIWIHDHTQLLENVCPGWGTEHIQSKK